MNRFFKKTAAAFCTAALVLINACAALSANAAEGVWPTEKRFTTITTQFDPNRNLSDASGYHNAIDIQADGGTNIYAVYPGTVVSADWKDAYGYLIILTHPDLGVYTFYAHCSQLKVSAGQTVKAGDVIGLVGSTGQSTGNHLHFGVCDTLQSGWPARIYYDPLTYFTYTDSPSVSDPQPVPSCSCSANYAGEYTTKGVNTYLNVRSGHSADYAVIGKVYPGEKVTVTKADGKWAHVILSNGVSGFCSMDYLQLVSELEPSMTINGQTYPSGVLAPGSAFSLRGKISSAYPIARIWGGVYDANGAVTSQYAEFAPNSTAYDLSSQFDARISFNALEKGDYVYKVEAEDSKGNKYELVRSEFSIGGVPEAKVAGDANCDGKLDIGDVVLLKKFLIGSEAFSSDQYNASDLDGDKKVDGFDLAYLRMELLEALAAKSSAN